MENLDVEVLAGTPFMDMNDIAVRPAKRLITIVDNAIILYGSTNTYPPPPPKHSARRAVVLRAPATSTVWPGDFLELQLLDDLPSDALHALEPRPTDTKQVPFTTSNELWSSPRIVSSIAGHIRIPNLSEEPIHIQRHQHFCQIIPVFDPPDHQDCEAIAASPALQYPTTVINNNNNNNLFALLRYLVTFSLKSIVKI